ncbi:MAG TPA: EamA family transporter [Longimicrobiales bacterium]
MRRFPAAALQALLAAALFGLSAPLAKLLLAGAPPQLLAGLLYLGSGVGLGAFWLVRRRAGGGQQAAERPLARADAPWLAGAICFGGVLGPLLLLVGLLRTPASTTALLLNLEGVFTALLAWTVFREHTERRIVAGMGLIVAGGLLLSWEGRAGWQGAAGPLAIAAGCLCWAIDNNLTQRVSGGDPVQVASLKGVVAGAVNLGIALALGASLPAAPALAGALGLGFVSYGVSLVLFILALRALGTARTGAYFSTAPFIGAGAALLLLHEPATVPLLAGGALMAAGVALHLTERHEHAHTHEATTHAHRHVHDEHHRHVHPPGTPPGEPHGHEHEHIPLRHSHPHYPDLHHRHGH